MKGLWQSERGVIIGLNFVHTLDVIVVAGDDAQVDMTYGVANGILQVGKLAQSLGAGEGEDISSPEEAFGFNVVGPAGSQEADGDLRTTLGLCDGESFGREFRKRVDNGIFGDKGVLHYSEDYFNRQMRKPVREMIQGGEA